MRNFHSLSTVRVHPGIYFRVVGWLLVMLLILNSGSIIKQDKALELPFLVISGILSISLLLLRPGYILRWRQPLFLTTILLTGLFAVTFSFQAISFNNLTPLISNQVFLFFFQLVTIIPVLFFFLPQRPLFTKCLQGVLAWCAVHGIINFLLFLVPLTAAAQFPLNLEFGDYQSIGYFFFERDFLYANVQQDYNTVNIGAFSFARNSGLFWEPSVLAYYMNILLFLSLFVHRSSALIFLAVLVILSTWSTTGLILMILQGLYYLRYYFIPTRRMVFVAVFSVIPLFFAIPTIYQNLEEKFAGKAAGSAQQRHSDTRLSLYVIGQYPLFGTGIDYETFKTILLESKRPELINTSAQKHGASTNGILTLFAQFGIPVALLYLFSIVRQPLIQKDKFLLAAINLIAFLVIPLVFLSLQVALFAAGFIEIFNLQWKKLKYR